MPDRYQLVGFKPNLRMPDEAGDEIVRPLIEDLLTEAENTADGLVPVDDGELKASKVRVVTGAGRNVRGELRYEAEHAAYVEYGTEDTPDQPYLRPALNRLQGRL